MTNRLDKGQQPVAVDPKANHSEAAQVVADQATLISEESREAESLLSGYWRRFRGHRLGIVGATIVGAFLLVAIFAPLLATHDYAEANWDALLFPPGSAGHPLGTDELGRDLYSRLVWGARISLEVAFVASGISAVIGATVGALSGYYGGRVDMVISSIMDLTWSFPLILLALVIIAVLGPGLTSVLLSFGLIVWSLYARVVRAEVLSLRNQEFVIAARAVGATSSRIILRHILPNTLGAVLVVFSVMMGQAMLVEAALSFLGIGVRPPTPSWGAIISGGHDYIRVAPWLTAIPGAAITIVVLGFNLLGDSIRDVVDPRMKI